VYGRICIMEKVIEETLKIAKEKFLKFGFKEEQIEQLLASGKRDLLSELEKLKALLATEPYDIEAINKSLHALKGLFFNMGNTEAGDIMADLRKEDNMAENIKKIKAFFKEGHLS